MRLRFQWVPEEDDKVNRAFRDFRADLLIAAERTALESRDREIELSFQDSTSGPSGVQIVLGQQITVELGPLKHVLFLVVVSDECNLLARSHSDRLVDHSLLLLGIFSGQTAATHHTVFQLYSARIFRRDVINESLTSQKQHHLESTMVTSSIRVVAVDIDGTLTDPQFHVSERNITALRAAHDAGLQIVLATGRRHDYAMPIARELAFPVFLVTSNAALVRSSDGQTWFTGCLAASTARKLIRYMDEYRGHAVLTFDRPGHPVNGALVLERADELNQSVSRWLEVNRPYIKFVVPLEDAL